MNPSTPNRSPIADVALFLAWLLCGACLVGAESHRKSYDIASGEAIEVLKEFKIQSGRQLLYSVDAIAGIKTHAIRGAFTPREALDRMFAGTALAVVEDPANGALSLVRSSDPNGQRAAHLTVPPGQNHGEVTGRVQNVATGQYLNNARVVVQGTDRAVFTDETGTYRLANITAGPVTLQFFYTGLEPSTITLEVVPGRENVRDVELTRFSRTTESGVVQLSSFTVTTARETDAQAIATNEQRFAPNMKLVVSTDTLGDVMDNNVGELLKHLPGITGDYDQADDTSTVSSISLRGFASNMTVVATDGAQMANISGATGGDRTFFFNQASVSNVARIEVFKVPTPANPANAIAGSVNMVSKSAFERKDAELRYNVDVTWTSLDHGLRRETNRNGDRIYKTLPNVTFDYTLPVNRNFGLVVTGGSTRRYNKVLESRQTYNGRGTATGATFARPYLQTFDIIDAPRIIERDSLGLKADWRVNRNGILSFNVQGGHYSIRKFPTRVLLDASANGTPTPASGRALSFGDTFTTGATGRGAVSIANAAATDRIISSHAQNLRYRFDNGEWRVLTGVSRSAAKGGNRDIAEGHFVQLAVGLKDPVRVSLLDIGESGPARVQVVDNANREVDLYDPKNYRITNATATPRLAEDIFGSANLDVRRRLGFLPFPSSVEAGSLLQVQNRDIRRDGLTWTYAGVNGDISPTPFWSAAEPARKDTVSFGTNSLPHVSPNQAWQAFMANPALFNRTPAQVYSDTASSIRASQFLEETVTAFYAAADAKFFKGSLQILGGVRYERVDDRGQGPLEDPDAVFVRTSQGDFARNASGSRIRRAEAGAAGSLDELRLTLQERAFKNHRQYDGFYPSLHFTWTLHENTIVRAAYARTYGRPNFTDMIPGITVDEDDANDVLNPTAVPGDITMTNTALKPWHAKNYDLSVEHYTGVGGMFSVGIFRKDISDFFGQQTRVMTSADTAELGLDPRFVGWRVTTKFNSGDARVTGIEASARHSLARLGGWGRFFGVYANVTKLHLEGSQDASFTGFVPFSVNGGITFNRKPFAITVKANYRGEQKGTRFANLGADAFEYDDSLRTCDASFEYQIAKRASLFITGQNIFEASIFRRRGGSETPGYARQFRSMAIGTTYRVGVKGAF